jgi:protein-tyrosine phosphatase
MMFEPNAHQIVPGLWLGDALSAPKAIRAGFAVLNVLEDSIGLAEDHIPILVPKNFDRTVPGTCAYRSRLADAVHWINDKRLRGRLLVHCAAGVERSPLTVTWWIMATTGVAYAEAFAWVKARRAVAEDRCAWIEPQ